MSKTKAKESGLTSDSLKEAINKKLGIRAATSWKEAKERREFKGFLSTGFSILDTLICNEKNANYQGGIPFGGLTMIAGEEQSGKSLLAGHIAASVLKSGGKCVFLNREYGADFDFWKRIGIAEDDPNMINVEISTIEQAFQVMDAVISDVEDRRLKNEKMVIIWDSLAATMTEDDLEKEISQIGEKDYPRAPRIINDGIKKIMSTVQKYGIALVFINQLRMKMNVGMYEDKYMIPGGQGLRHFCDVIIRLHISGKQEVDGERVATGVKVVIAKNRVAPPLRKYHMWAYFGTGFREELSYLERLQEKGIVKKSGKTNVIEWKGEEKRFLDKNWLKMLQDSEFYKWVVRQVVDSYIINHAEEVELKNLIGKVNTDTGEILGDIDEEEIEGSAEQDQNVDKGDEGEEQKSGNSSKETGEEERF